MAFNERERKGGRKGETEEGGRERERKLARGKWVRNKERERQTDRQRETQIDR